MTKPDKAKTAGIDPAKLYRVVLKSKIRIGGVTLLPDPERPHRLSGRALSENLAEVESYEAV